MITEEQRDARWLGLGGSDAPAVLGLSPFKTPLQLWLEKTGQTPPVDLQDNEAVQWGNRLEALVADEFARRTGYKLARVHNTLRHRRLPFMLAHLDRRITGKHELVEVKTVRALDDDAPRPDHVAQVLHYLAVTGWRRGHLAYLVAGQELRTYTVEHDADAIAGLEAAETEFWLSVLQRRPPPPVNLADVRLLHPVDHGKSLTASDELLAAVEQLARLKAEAKRLETRIEQTEMLIQQGMGDAAELLAPDGRVLATWKTAKPSHVLDRVRLEQDLPDIVQHYTVERPGSRRFLLKVAA